MPSPSHEEAALRLPCKSRKPCFLTRRRRCHPSLILESAASPRVGGAATSLNKEAALPLPSTYLAHDRTFDEDVALPLPSAYLADDSGFEDWDVSLTQPRPVEASLTLGKKKFPAVGVDTSPPGFRM